MDTGLLHYKWTFVPDNFGLSVTVPVVKDKTKDVCSADNYRPIALSPVI